MEESTALLQKYPNAYASLQLLVQIPTVLRSLYEAAGTEKLTFGDLPPALQACLYDVDILLYPCLFAWTESDGSSVMGLFALMESSGSAINFLDRNVVSRQGIDRLDTAGCLIPVHSKKTGAERLLCGSGFYACSPDSEGSMTESSWKTQSCTFRMS